MPTKRRENSSNSARGHQPYPQTVASAQSTPSSVNDNIGKRGYGAGGQIGPRLGGGPPLQHR